ncbi:MAG: NTP transferase domain-containing protein [Deltaproteobacteria bacterium]|nr:NTP transferase domain-containing protein [Deltaproteobacteria bacterium]
MDVLGIVLAGGRGERLYPLTTDRAKPAVPFGGKYRIIDFVLSNFVNSGIHAVYVLTQFKSQSLIEHLEQGWRISDLMLGQFITVVPAQMRTGEEWYQGTADSVNQNIFLIRRHDPEIVAVFGADHIYRMNIRQMIDEHRKMGAEVTVAALPVSVDEASQFGILAVDQDWRVVRFDEKPAAPRPIPGEPTHALASMGNYIFNTDVLVQSLAEDADNPHSSHDFGRDVLPALVGKRKLYAYDFRKNRIPRPHKGEEPSYWRDIGTIEAYYDANMDLRTVDPSFNLYNVSEGTIISGSLVRGSVIGRNVRIHSYNTIEDSIIMDWVEIGRGCWIRRTIIDKGNVILPGTEIGHDIEKDRQRYFVSESGIVVIARSQPKTAWVLSSS